MRLVLALCLACSAASAQTVSLNGSMGADRALLIIDGKPRTVSVGSTVNGVKLLRLDEGQAQVDVGGNVMLLRIGAAPGRVGEAMGGSAGSRIVLTAGLGGHFETTGSINGRSVQFLVDTGATNVAISQGEADRIGLDKVERARLLAVILSAAELGRHLRRSPRKVLAIPVRLLSEDPRERWEEDTETVTVSRCGALVRSQHSAELDQRLRVLRPDEGRQARARVAWCPPERETNPLLAVEFIDSDNFWGLDWGAIETELMGQGDQPRSPN